MFFCLFLTVLRAFSCSSVTLFEKFLGALGKFALLANLSIEMRARSRCASGPASLDSRVLSLSEGRARVSTQVGRALIDCPRWPARLRRTAVGAPAFFPRISARSSSPFISGSRARPTGRMGLRPFVQQNSSVVLHLRDLYLEETPADAARQLICH